MPYPRLQGLTNFFLSDSSDDPGYGRQLAHLVQGKLITSVGYKVASRRSALYASTPTQDKAIENIQDWLKRVLAGAETESILLLHGPIGVGKTFVMQKFTEIKANAPTLRATLFLSDTDQLPHILITIAYQLASQSENYQHYLVELLCFAYPNLMEASLDEQFEKLFTKPLQRLGKTMLNNHEGTSLIVIDGFDSCHIERFFTLIDRFKGCDIDVSHPTLVWLISSRSPPPVGLRCQKQEVAQESDVTDQKMEGNRRAQFLSQQLVTYLVPNIDFELSHLPPPPHLTMAQRKILDNILSWVESPSHGNGRVLWLHGYVGVGKSTVMQSLAHVGPKSLGAKIFFSGPDTPNDSQHIFTTIAYQLSEKYSMYKEYITDLLESNPTAFEESMEHQFGLFIRRPLGEDTLLTGFGTILIILDGLDQLVDELSKRDLVLLVCRFSREYPKAPLIWIITSRPERHMQDAFSEAGSLGTYWEMKIGLDVKGVEEYLRVKFQDLRTKFNQHHQWPTKADFTKITQCASGLYLIAAILIQCIHNLHPGDPDSSLRETLDLISHVFQPKHRDYPFLVLKDLYAGIYASIGKHDQAGTQRLFTLLLPGMHSADFVLACNWAGISRDISQKFYLLLDIPSSPEEGFRRPPRAFHGSFVAYLTTLFPDVLIEERNALETNISFLKQAHNPDQHIVQTSQLPLSWPHQDGQIIRDSLFEWSLTWFLDTGHTVIGGDSYTLLSDLAPFFQDLDYRKNIRICGSRNNLIRGYIFHENISQFMQEWDVQSETFPASDLEQDRFCWNEEACILDILGDHPQGKVGSRGAWRVLFSSVFYQGVLDQELQRRVVDCTTTSAFSSASAMFIGKGNQACVLMRFVGFDGIEGSYLIPYDRPELQ